MSTSASVKVMLSYDYCHFEISRSFDADGITIETIDNLRKDCMRLADKAIAQYKIAKEAASKRIDGKLMMENFKHTCQMIENKAPVDRTIKEIAMLEQFKNEKYREQYLYPYDYEDEEPEWMTNEAF